MKNLLGSTSFISLTLISIFFVCSANSASVKEGVYIFDGPKKHLDLFAQNPELTIDLIDEDGYELYGPDGMIKWLTKEKINFFDLNEIQGKLYKYNAKNYLSVEELYENLKSLADSNPHILRLFSIGTSVDGRDINVIKISDNPMIDEVEPEFKYIANMHGNEIVGRELTTKFIFDLVKKYNENDPQIRKIINNTEIFIIPTMNPDGCAKKRRGNSNWRDLNRDFPDFTNKEENNFEGRAPETVSIMKFQRKRNFALSANFHDGAIVVNYPWDSTYDTFPMNDLIISLSTEYASTVPGMYDSHNFYQGVTNGASWYIILGGMQDWSYYYQNDLQITVELSLVKWPIYSDIPIQYQNNYNSMLTYLERIHQGAGFKITDNTSNGTVEIFKIEENDMFTDIGSYQFTHGEFYKVLIPGTYQFRVTNNLNQSISFKTIVGPEINQSNGNFTNINYSTRL